MLLNKLKTSVWIWVTVTGTPALTLKGDHTQKKVLMHKDTQCPWALTVGETNFSLNYS